MKILLHICCANCALYPITSLTDKGHIIKGFWFNPNIHPVTEYNLRLETVKRLQALWKLDIIYRDEYGLVDFIRNVCGNEQNRCIYCYTTRLEETARTAKKEGMDMFSSTLMYSRYQKFDTLVDIGKKIEEKYSIKFYVEDFRIGWHKGIEMSKALNLYRQQYCGCIYSEMERYLPDNKIEQI